MSFLPEPNKENTTLKATQTSKRNYLHNTIILQKHNWKIEYIINSLTCYNSNGKTVIFTSYPVTKMQGELIAPSDKSCSHRAFIFAALANGKSKLSGVLDGQDVLRTAKAIEKLGAIVEKCDRREWIVKGNGLLQEPKDTLDFGNSGTGCRLTLGAIAGFPIAASATGDESLRSRPMNRIIGPLSKMGASIRSRNLGLLPLTIEGSDSLSGINHKSKIASAQVKSAILLAGLNADGETNIEEPQLTRDHTERMVLAFGGVINSTVNPDESIRIRLPGRQSLYGTEVSIPGDPSSVAFFIACGLLGNSRKIEISNVMLNPTRCGFIEIAKQMGGNIKIVSEQALCGETVGTILVKSSQLKSIKVPETIVSSMIDEFPILAILASFAKGETFVTGARELRVKECDRILAIVTMLRANGIEIEEQEDGFIIQGCNGTPKGGGYVETFRDHRIAMSALILGTATQNPVTVDNISMIATSYPNFIRDLADLGASVKEGTSDHRH